MSIYRKDETGVVKKVATPIIQRWNDRIFTTTRSAELVNGVMSTVYDIDPSANKYISGLSNYTEFQLYFGQANNYSTVYVRFNNKMLLLKRSYAASQPIAINTLRYRTTCYTLDTSSNEIWTDYSTDMTLVNNDIIQLKDGTTTVKKAEQDASGNVITTTYETKSDATSKLLTKEDKSMKGQPNGYAPLDVSGYIPSAFVPNSFDDVIEFNTYADLLSYSMPQSNKLFVVKQDETSGGNHSTYRWTGTIYIRVTDEMSAAEIKALYESNADTNPLTDALKNKLDGLLNGSQYYDKTYIDALKDQNGWESQLLTPIPMTPNGMIANQALLFYDTLKLQVKNTATSFVDTDSVQVSIGIVTGNKIQLSDTSVYLEIGITTSTFKAPVGWELQIVGLKYTELKASDVSTNEVGVTVQDKLNEIDLEFRQVGETTITYQSGVIVSVSSDNVVEAIEYDVNGEVEKVTSTYADGKVYEETYTKDVNGNITQIMKVEVI